MTNLMFINCTNLGKITSYNCNVIALRCNDVYGIFLQMN